jgi:hypothetical protein
MEKIVYSERIRELTDILARKLVVRKAKNLWATAMQHTKNALAVDYSAAMDVSRDCMLSHVRRYQKEEDVLETTEPDVKKELGELLTEFFKGRIVRIADSLFVVFDKVSFDNPKNAVAHFHGKAFDTSLKEIDRDSDSCMAIIKSVPSPMRLIEKNGEHYDIAFPTLHFVTWEDLEPEFAMVDKTGTFKETVLTMLGLL